MDLSDGITVEPNGIGPGWIVHSRLWLPRPVEEVFNFFADAFQLEAITPPWLNFQVVTPHPIELQQGTLIDYRLKLRGIPMRWRSEISVWEPPFRFVDEQRKGPYSFWHHEHRFSERDGGTLCIDDVTYGVPGGWLVNRLLVQRDVLRIFEYRQQRMRELFDAREASATST